AAMAGLLLYSLPYRKLGTTGVLDPSGSGSGVCVGTAPIVAATTAEGPALLCIRWSRWALSRRALAPCAWSEVRHAARWTQLSQPMSGVLLQSPSLSAAVATAPAALEAAR
ncbi:hypothetical protein Vafri_15600, partial [Volvox africanus]